MGEAQGFPHNYYSDERERVTHMAKGEKEGVEFQDLSAEELKSLGEQKPLPPRANVEIDVKDEEAIVSRKMRTAATESARQEHDRIQSAIRKAAIVCKDKIEKKIKADPKSESAQRPVWIRAMKTLQPPPRVGWFSFMDEYTNFIEGMRYLCPLFVGAALEETDNAVILE